MIEDVLLQFWHSQILKYRCNKYFFFQTTTDKRVLIPVATDIGYKTESGSSDNPCEFLSAFKTSGTCPPQLTSHGLPCTCPFNPSSINLPPSVFEIAQINTAWQWLATVSHQIYISIAKRVFFNAIREHQLLFLFLQC